MLLFLKSEKLLKYLAIHSAFYTRMWEGKRERGVHIDPIFFPHLAGIGVTVGIGHEDEASLTIRGHTFPCLKRKMEGGLLHQYASAWAPSHRWHLCDAWAIRWRGGHGLSEGRCCLLWKSWRFGCVIHEQSKKSLLQAWSQDPRWLMDFILTLSFILYIII